MLNQSDSNESLCRSSGPQNTSGVSVCPEVLTSMSCPLRISMRRGWEEVGQVKEGRIRERGQCRG